VAHLTSLRLSGWKSIKDAKIEIGPLNVLIGANGAGKSNLISFFKLISEMRGGRFQIHVGITGGSESLLHYGSKRTSAIEAKFRFATASGDSDYTFRLVPAAGTTLIFEEEKLTFYWEAPPAPSQSMRVRSEHGHRESALTLLYDMDNLHTDFDRSGESIRRYLTNSRVFHFHDTSFNSPMRKDCAVDANRFLYSDAANLPAMLYLYKNRYNAAYNRIVAAVKAVAPFFDDFVLEPSRLNPMNIALHWRAKESDPDLGKGTGTGMSGYEFAAHQLSDGTLRAIALFTLLLQPEEDRPEMIVLDEPELGLHPAALAVLADLMKSASRHSQLVIATQSTALLDHFEVDDIITVNLRDGSSTFERLDPEALKEWLEDYSLSELWERNVIGGGPY
jgi:predicted ATPase